MTASVYRTRNFARSNGRRKLMWQPYRGGNAVTLETYGKSITGGIPHFREATPKDMSIVASIKSFPFYHRQRENESSILAPR
jgi:hypothetical protein